jgi:hypothetical protein
MSANKYLPHVLVLPEDDANSQLANGFHLQVDWARYRQMDVLPVAGGWKVVLERFLSDHVVAMNHYPSRFMVLLIDFDGREDRLQDVKARIPGHLVERVFILGVLSEPEALTKDLGSFETIGSALAEDCREDTDTTWGHELLRHNADELDRLRDRVRPILFPS